MDAFIIIISLAIIIIVSHFLNIYSEKTGVPSVLILILFGIFLQFDSILIGFEILNETTRKSLLEVLGVAGLILILLEAALDLEINKSMLFSAFKAFIVAILGLIGTAFVGAYILQYFIEDIDFMHALLYSVPLSILSSAIIIPSIQGFNEEKKSFLIYESTFSDVLGLLMFQVVLGSLKTGNVMSSSQVLWKLGSSILFSVFISVVLIYLFQKIRGHTKLFLLFSILILLYSIGEALHLSSLLIILIFGIILNNYKSVFIGGLSKFINSDNVDIIQDDFKVIIRESSFVVRTFFFILFGYYVSLKSLLNIEVIIISLVLFAAIYTIRLLLIAPTLKGRIWPEIFLAPRGLITILLFFSIPDEYICSISFHTDVIPGVLLFIILGTALTMSNALIGFKKMELKKDLEASKREETVLLKQEQEPENNISEEPKSDFN